MLDRYRVSAKVERRTDNKSRWVRTVEHRATRLTFDSELIPKLIESYVTRGRDLPFSAKSVVTLYQLLIWSTSVAQPFFNAYLLEVKYVLSQTDGPSTIFHDIYSACAV